jgi:hypothetical protein
MQLKKNIAISETGFLFDPTTGDSYTVNSTGLEILSLLKQNKSNEEVIRFIMDKYDVDPSSFERYYYDFISMLKHFQIIEPNAKY